MINEKIIGIDLGTSNSAASFYDGVKAEMIPSEEGASLYGKAFPSYVAFTEDGSLLVGEAARVQAITNPENTITKVKRKMGTNETFKINGKEYLPQDISAFILQKIKKDSSEYIGEKVTKAVITVPAYFDDNQRTATKDAGTIAGLDVVRIINEPTAAAIAYGIDKEGQDDVNILVYDLGGGTLDITIMRFGNGEFIVKSTSGDTQLGGTDMDEKLVEYIANDFKEKHGINLLEDPHAKRRLESAAEEAKIKLSTVLTTEINLPFIIMDDEGSAKNLNMEITREKLEELVGDIVDKSGITIQQALDDANMTKSDIDKLIFVGGPTRMPIVKDYVEKFLETESVGGIDPMECVSIGASLLGAMISGEGVKGFQECDIHDVTPLSLGTEVLGGITVTIIERNTEIPVKKSDIFTTSYDNQEAVRVNVLQGERKMARDNVDLGDFLLSGIPPAPRGVPQIEVTFDIDINGILNVYAKDLGTGHERSITITSPNKLSEAEIERKIKEARDFSDEDDKRKEVAEIINDAISMIRKTERSLEKYGTTLPHHTIVNIKSSIQEVIAAVNSEDPARIRAKMEQLSIDSQDIGNKIYS